MSKKVIPFGNRILVKRRVVGEKALEGGSIVLPDSAKERETDLADVVYVPDLTFTDRSLIDNAERIIGALTDKARGGDSKALNALLDYNEFLKIKTIKVGDAVMISKYIGTSFHDNKGGGNLTLVKGSDVIGLVVDE